MSLRDVAEQDLYRILTDQAGFRVDLQLTDPAGQSATLGGFSNDISQAIDPDTGQMVSGRFVHVTIALRDLDAQDLPRGRSRRTDPAWLVSFDNPAGIGTVNGAVIESHPDRSLGYIVLVLEVY